MMSAGATRAANQLPSESMRLGAATCTGLSMLLVMAMRSQGIPARVVGTPAWRFAALASGSPAGEAGEATGSAAGLTTEGGNHNWVECFVSDGTAVAQWRARVLRIAPVITALQISQFAWGTVINAIAAVAYAKPEIGCAIQPAILYLAAGLYLAYGALFVQLFVRRYLRPQPKRAAGLVRASDGAASTNGHGNGHHDGPARMPFMHGHYKNGAGSGLKAV